MVDEFHNISEGSNYWVRQPPPKPNANKINAKDLVPRTSLRPYSSVLFHALLELNVGIVIMGTKLHLKTLDRFVLSLCSSLTVFFVLKFSRRHALAFGQ